MIRKRFRENSRPKWSLIFFVVLPLVISSCAGRYSTQQTSFIRELDANIGVATLDDVIAAMGPPQQSLETPEGSWYTWRKVNAGSVSVGASPIPFFGVSMSTPAETGQELNCQFDRGTGRLKSWSFREW